MKNNKKLILNLNVLSVIVLFMAILFSNTALAGGAIVINDVRHDVSPPLGSTPEQTNNESWAEVKPYSPPPMLLYDNNAFPSFTDLAATDPIKADYKLTSLPINSFQGVGIGLGSYQPTVSPPDTNGAAGPTQYVQWINPGFGVFDKATGKILPGFPKSGSSLFTGTGGLCETTNRGDGIVKYDQLADRWVITKFAFPDRNVGPFAQCVAVSVTSDATGAYYRYEFPFDSLNDYGKLGMWPDAYYLTLNMVGPKTFGPRICGIDRKAMLQGKPASMQCFQLDFLASAAILPGDLDGKTLPPAGTPEYLMGMQKPNILKLYKAHIDFTDSTKSSLSDAETITVPNFSMPCESDAGDNCAVQPNTTMKLDTLSDRLMNRLAYRQFSDHGSLVVTHTIVSDPSNATASNASEYDTSPNPRLPNRIFPNRPIANQPFQNQPGVTPFPTQPIQPWPTQPIQPWPTQPTQPIQPWPTQPTQPIQPWPTQPTQPIQPWPTQPTQPIQPLPTQPTQPVQPIQPLPTQPTQPVQPIQPVPTQPTQPPIQPVPTPGTATSMIRWYEIRFNNGSTTPTLYQTGNHAIVNNGWGWAGSIAMDKFGNIAFGYSKSSSTLFPSIGVSARLASAPLGKLSINANVIKGTGSQTDQTRWGDYSGMSIDPVDDCTFWYTTEYRQANATGWSTYIASFKLPGC